MYLYSPILYIDITDISCPFSTRRWLFGQDRKKYDIKVALTMYEHTDGPYY